MLQWESEEQFNAFYHFWTPITKCRISNSECRMTNARRSQSPDWVSFEIHHS
jgi:hypothetical protein